MPKFMGGKRDLEGVVARETGKPIHETLVSLIDRRRGRIL